jgi:hypothetical protein
MLYSGDENSKQCALKCFTDLVSWSNHEQLLHQIKQPVNEASQTANWGSWVEEETKRRTGYFIWVFYTFKEVLEMPCC